MLPSLESSLLQMTDGIKAIYLNQKQIVPTIKNKTNQINWQNFIKMLNERKKYSLPPQKKRKQGSFFGLYYNFIICIVFLNKNRDGSRILDTSEPRSLARR